jgi:hypothetical protein
MLWTISPSLQRLRDQVDKGCGGTVCTVIIGSRAPPFYVALREVGGATTTISGALD